MHRGDPAIRGRDRCEPPRRCFRRPVEDGHSISDDFLCRVVSKGRIVAEASSHRGRVGDTEVFGPQLRVLIVESSQLPPTYLVDLVGGQKGRRRGVQQRVVVSQPSEPVTDSRAIVAASDGSDLVADHGTEYCQRRANIPLDRREHIVAPSRNLPVRQLDRWGLGRHWIVADRKCQPPIDLPDCPRSTPGGRGSPDSSAISQPVDPAVDEARHRPQLGHIPSAVSGCGQAVRRDHHGHHRHGIHRAGDEGRVSRVRK